MQHWMPRLLAAAIVVVAAAPIAAAQKQAVPATDSKLAAPEKLWAARTSPSELTVVWQPVKGATGYEIHERKPDGSSVKVMALLGQQVNRVVIPIGRLLAEYAAAEGERLTRLFLVAMNGQKSSTPAWFNEVFVGPQKGLARAATPANVTASETSPGVITVTWDEVPGATAYTIGRAVGNDGYRRHCDLCPTGGRFVDTVATTGVRYSYSVVAVAPGGASTRATTPPLVPTGGAPLPDSKGATEAPAGTDSASKESVPGAPTSLKSALVADDKGRRGVRLSWRAGVSTVVYEVARSACNGPLEVIARLEPPPFQPGIFPTMAFVDALSDELIRRACTVRYELKGINPKGAVSARFDDVPLTPAGGGTSGASAAIPAPPTNPVARMLSGNEIRLTWVAAPGATSYRIERAIGASSYQVIAKLSGDATGYSDARTGLVKQNPKYRIRAVNAAGASAAVSFP